MSPQFQLCALLQSAILESSKPQFNYKFASFAESPYIAEQQAYRANGLSSPFLWSVCSFILLKVD